MSRDHFKSSYASPPCLAAEIAPDYFDPLAVDPEQDRDVARWRKAQRATLLADRAALTAQTRTDTAAALAKGLDALLADIAPDLTGKVVSGYWPIKFEPDLRFWLDGLAQRGAVPALPVVDVVGAPLIFRPWHGQMPMRRGHWNIFEPDCAQIVVPDIILAPLVGWQIEGFRLGYGGGYFDRTLGARKAEGNMPIAVGVGFASAQLGSIFPQPHDIRMDHIITDKRRMR